MQFSARWTKQFEHEGVSEAKERCWRATQRYHFKHTFTNTQPLDCLLHVHYDILKLHCRVTSNEKCYQN